MTTRYLSLAEKGLNALRRVLLFMLVLIVGLLILFRLTPTGFVPDEDLGAFFVQTMLPEAASTERTAAVVEQLSEQIGALPGVQDVLGVTGLDLMSGTAAPNGGLLVVRLRPWEDRTEAEQQVSTLISNVMGIGMQTPESITFAFNPPALPGFGQVSGFSMMLQARGAQSAQELAATVQQFIAAAQQRPEIGYVRTTFAASTPNYRLHVDREKIKKLGIPIDDVFGTLQTYLGGVQVNDFTRFGKNYRVTVQADAEFRRDISTLSALFVRNGNGQMVPLDTVVTAEPSFGPRFTLRYNLYRSAEITGAPAEGFSSGQALQALQEVAAAVLPTDYGYEWSGQTLEEVRSGSTAVFALLLSVVLAFLFLAALYESWAVPFAVILAVPFGILGAFLALLIAGSDFNVYAQIALVTLVGLAAKNAILIVEFAKIYHEQGMEIRSAALEAAKVRLRPILMTSFAFIFGVVPLVIASGAGAASKHAVGIPVIGGMLSATLLAIFFVPALYVITQGLAERFGAAPPTQSGDRNA